MNTQRPPNVVFVLTDDQGYGDLGCHGNPHLKTPNLDRFHGESVRFTNFHVGPTCAPTRSGLMTGHHANSTGVWHTIGGRSLLRKDEWTLPAALKGAGYATGIFGKWHLGDSHPYRPQDRGFDHVVVHGGGGISQTPDFWGNDYFDDTYFVNGVPTPFKGYCTEVFTGLALDFITEHKDQPFFCYLATNAPHSPYNVEKKYSDPYSGLVPDDRARFYGMITNIDEQWQRLRKHLAALGLESNTILMFMTDNGSSAGCVQDREGHVIEGFNAGLRGMKGSPYEGGHRVPFFLRFPVGGFSGGRDLGALTAHVDVMPTLLDLCGVDASGHSFHGETLRPLMEGEVPRPRVVVTDSQRLVKPVKWRDSAVMDDRFRLINGRELYDITRDVGQRSDISFQYPHEVERLRAEYETWWSLVSTQIDETIPISLGGIDETCLTAHDWRGDAPECVWNQAQIRQGKETNSYFEVLVEKAGRYRFELRRWPREAGHGIDAGIEGSDVTWREDVVDPKYRAHYDGGKSLAVTRASLSIGGLFLEAVVPTGSPSISFEVALAVGETRLQTFMGNEKGLSLGAYYVYVRFLG